MIIKNKKGDLATTLLVFMTLVLVGAALLSFIYSKGIEATIADSRFIDNLYIKEDQIKFYLTEAGVNSLAKSYDDIVKGDFLVSSPKKENEVLVFDNFNENFANDNLKEKFSANLKREIAKYKFNDKTLLEFQKEISAGKFNVDLKDDVFFIEFRDFSIKGGSVIGEKERIWVWGFIPTTYKEEKLKSLISVIYRPAFLISVNITENGLATFKEIYFVSNVCKGEENTAQCISNRLKVFDVGVQKQDKYKFVSLKSKQKFLVNEELKNIEIKFLI